MKSPESLGELSPAQIEAIKACLGPRCAAAKAQTILRERFGIQRSIGSLQIWLARWGVAPARPFHRMHVENHHEHDALESLIRTEPDPRVRNMLELIRLAKRRESVAAVAAARRVSKRTVQTWVSWYNQGGVEELRRRVEASPHRTRAEKYAHVADALRARVGNRRISAAQMQAIAAEYGISLTVSSCHHLMRTLGIPNLRRRDP